MTDKDLIELLTECDPEAVVTYSEEGFEMTVEEVASYPGKVEIIGRF